MNAILISIFLSPLGLTAEAVPTVSPSERESIYEERGLNYAKDLYLKLDGSPEDEKRSLKSEALNHKIRERGIQKLEEHLTRSHKPALKREIQFRLSQMYEQQAEVISRRSDVKDKQAKIDQALRNSVKHLQAIRRDFPKHMPDSITFSLAENYAKLKDSKRAEQFYREVIQKYPKSAVVADALLAIGNLYFERQLFIAARGFYGKILDTPETKLYPYAHYKTAWCYFNESDFPSALAGLEKSIYESRKLTQNGDKKLGVEDEALSDLVLFFAEYGNPTEATSYFEKLVSKEKANELRYNLSRRLYEHGKHLAAKDVAKQLLDENPQKEFVNKLYLILISVAERTKDRDFGLKTAQKLSGWVKEENLAKDDVSRIETEEYMRQYSQKLHYEAETMKNKEVWQQARKSYEIYLQTFPSETETAEVKFRYSVLLLNQKEQLKAYQFISEALAGMDEKHPRFKEALKIKIQSIELASKTERKSIDNRDLMATYDLYAKHFPTEELGIEARYKAATLAKELESPEQAALRFRELAQAHPENKLAKASVGEALAVLVSAQKWEALQRESGAFSQTALGQSLGSDPELGKKLSEASDLANVKLTEQLESEGKFAEAKSKYEGILKESPSQTMSLFAYVKLITLAENKMKEPGLAIDYLKALKEKHPSSKEAGQANLEIARLYEKTNRPREAVAYYQDFGRAKTGKVETQALTNAAVILDTLGEKERAAAAYFELAKNLRSTNADKEAKQALEAACNNVLLSAHEDRSKEVLQSIVKCSQEFAQDKQNSLLWQARAAWALDLMADNIQADQTWKKIAAKSVKATPETERAYLAMAKLKLAQVELTEFQKVKFSKTNERPEANIGNKTKAMEKLEKTVENIIAIGSSKQILEAKNILKAAYNDFADTMEQSALPSKLSDAEKEELRKAFNTFAQDFRQKASVLEVKEENRSVASVDASPSGKEEEIPSLGRLSSEEEDRLAKGEVPSELAAQIYAKKAYSLFKDGKYGDARYFSEKWKRNISSISGESENLYNQNNFEIFQRVLTSKVPSTDPLSQSF